jgi:hypothetical protein
MAIWPHTDMQGPVCLIMLFNQRNGIYGESARGCDDESINSRRLP